MDDGPDNLGRRQFLVQWEWPYVPGGWRGQVFFMDPDEYVRTRTARGDAVVLPEGERRP